VFNVHNVEPGQVCVRGLCEKVVWFPGFAPGNQGQPREDQGNRRDAAASPHQGCLEARGMLGRTQLVYL
jgi:hypothetical protein